MIPSRRLAAATGLVLLAAGPLGAAEEGGAPAMNNLAVSTFTPTNASAGEAEVVTSFVRQAFVRSGTWTVVEKGSMDAILREQAFQQTGCTSADCAIKLGKLLNVHKMVVGQYAIIEGTRFLTASFIDVETGKIERTGKVKGFTAANMDEAADDLMAQLAGGAAAAVPPAKPKPEPLKKTPAEEPAAKPEVASAPEGPPLDQARGVSPRVTGARFGLGLNYPGAGVRWHPNDRFALEARGQFEPGVLVAGGRGYLTLASLGRIVVAAAAEADYGSYAATESWGEITATGTAFGGFLTAEYYMWKRVALQLDLGMAQVALTGGQGGVETTAGGVSLVTGFGLTWYLGGREN